MTDAPSARSMELVAKLREHEALVSPLGDGFPFAVFALRGDEAAHLLDAEFAKEREAERERCVENGAGAPPAPDRAESVVALAQLIRDTQDFAYATRLLKDAIGEYKDGTAAGEELAKAVARFLTNPPTFTPLDDLRKAFNAYRALSPAGEEK